MATKIGDIFLDLNLNTKAFNKQISNTGAYAENTMTKAFSGVKKAVAGALSIAAIGAFAKSCIDLGSDLEEVQNVVDVTFPNMNQRVNEFSQNAINQFGLSEKVAKQMVGTFGAMAKSFGFSESAAYDMATQLTGLSGDVASFYNLDPTEAYTKLKSVFSGETETLKDLGIVMTQNALDQYALANGFGKTTAQMSEQEKVALRLAFVTDQLNAAGGDFARTSDSWANKVRVLSLNFQSLKATLGQGFIAVLSPIVSVINNIIVKLNQAAKAIMSFISLLTGKKIATSVGNTANTVEQMSSGLGSAASGASDLADSVGSVGGAAKKAAKEMGSLAGFDEIKNIKTSSSSDGGGSGGGSGGAGGLGEIGSVDFIESTEQTTGLESALNSLVMKAKELANIFSIGFTIGFGDSYKNINRLKDYLSSIGKHIKKIFTSKDVVTAASNWVNETILALGKISGSIASVGVTIATLFVGSVASYLENNTEFIQSTIVKWFNLDAQSNFILGNFSVVLADIASIFASPTAVNIGANLMQIIVNGALGSILLVKELGVDILDMLTAPFIENKDSIKSALENMLKPIESITKALADSVNDTLSAFFEVYETYIKPTFVNIKQGLTELVSVLVTNFNTYIAPVLETIGTQFASMWQEHVQPAINGIITFIGKFTELAGTVLNEFLIPITAFLIETFSPILASVIEVAWSIIEGFISFVSDSISNAIDILNGICDFLNGVFTSNWDLIWKGIQEIFGAVWEQIRNIADTVTDILEATIGEFLNKVWDIWESIWNEISNFCNGIWEGICSFISGFINSIQSFIASSLEAISSIWNDIWSGISEFCSGIWQGISTAVETSINVLKDTISSVLNQISSIWMNMWNGLKNFVKTTWDTIIGFFSKGGKIFDGVVGAIGDIFKSICNAILSGINKVIAVPFKTINKALSTIHNINIPMIGKPFTIVPEGISIPQIPLLAQGGFVEANTPRLAMIGDNKRYGEIVTPENKMFEVMMSALQAYGAKHSENEDLQVLISILYEILDAIKNLRLIIDGDSLSDDGRKRDQERALRTGKLIY